MIVQCLGCGGYGMNDYDIITASSIGILKDIIIYYHYKELNQKEDNIIGEVKQNIEEEGIEDEIDLLQFHSNTRSDIAIAEKAQSFQNVFNGFQIEFRFDIDEDFEQEVNYNIDDDDDDDDDDDEEEEDSDDDVVNRNLFSSLMCKIISKH
ncbi:MAG: hypothetical protein EZS28_045338 [Streblomastix strix]|uniref:Uncharacterized protein n=1 Tax=Streblomastix strix TaxID=222440 RepID=A0A5J4TNV7_9EUKA|nr:MAG: hypothetical protein EZS28_045338 [Streblomastix strix]